MSMPPREVTFDLLNRFLAFILRDRFFGTIELGCENGRIYSVRTHRMFKKEDMETLTTA